VRSGGKGRVPAGPPVLSAVECSDMVRQLGGRASSRRMVGGALAMAYEPRGKRLARPQGEARAGRQRTRPGKSSKLAPPGPRTLESRVSGMGLI